MNPLVFGSDNYARIHSAHFWLLIGHVQDLLAEVERLRAKYEPPECGPDCEHKREAERITRETGRAVAYHIAP